MYSGNIRYGIAHTEKSEAAVLVLGTILKLKN